MAYLDSNGLLYFWQKVKTLLAGKVDKVDGKGLSTNDYTTAEKTKLAGLNNYSLPTASSTVLGGVKVGNNLSVSDGVLSATDTKYSDATTTVSGLMSGADKTKLNGVSANAQVNVIESVKVNGTALTVSAKSVDITVPTNTNQLTNGAGFQTASQVQALIAGAGHLKREKVTTLPTTGNDNTIYMISKSGANGDVFDEYMYIDGKYELIGNSTVDLSGYIKSSEKISNAEIDTVVAS